MYKSCILFLNIPFLGNFLCLMPKKNKPVVTLIIYDSIAVGSANAGDVGLIPGSGRSPRNGNPLQYS